MKSSHRFLIVSLKESDRNPCQDYVKKKAYLHRGVDVFEPRAKKLVPKSYISMNTSSKCQTLF